MALVSNVGGAAGPLYGTLFLQHGHRPARARTELDLGGWTEALDAAGDRRPGSAARPSPATRRWSTRCCPRVEALRGAQPTGASSRDALRRSADAADEGMRATIPMEARKGRASYLGPRSVGHQDPGATSTHLLLDAAGEVAFA